MTTARDHFAARWAAQEARKDMRAGDHEYATQGGTRFQSAAEVVDTDQWAKADVAVAAPPVRPRDVASSPTPPEREVLKAVLAALKAHPRVAFAERMNSGAYKSQAGHYVRYGFPGCPDVLGMLKDGRILAVEVKRPGGRPSDGQVEFLGRVARYHGLAFVAWSADDVARALDPQKGAA